MHVTTLDDLTQQKPVPGRLYTGDDPGYLDYFQCIVVSFIIPVTGREAS